MARMGPKEPDIATHVRVPPIHDYIANLTFHSVLLSMPCKGKEPSLVSFGGMKLGMLCSTASRSFMI